MPWIVIWSCIQTMSSVYLWRICAHARTKQIYAKRLSVLKSNLETNPIHRKNSKYSSKCLMVNYETKVYTVDYNCVAYRSGLSRSISGRRRKLSLSLRKMTTVFAIIICVLVYWTSLTNYVRLSWEVPIIRWYKPISLKCNMVLGKERCCSDCFFSLTQLIKKCREFNLPTYSYITLVWLLKWFQWSTLTQTFECFDKIRGSSRFDYSNTKPVCR